MKKITIVVLALLVTATCLFGCNNAQDGEERSPFAFGYQIDKTEVEQGERIAITATVTNISGEDYTYTGAYTDFRPNVRLHSFDEDGEIDKVINHEPVESTDDIGDHVIKDGQTVTYTYYFNIPEDAYCTDYAIYISCFGYGREIKDAVKVVEKAAREPDEYNSGMFSEGRLYFHNSKGSALLVDSKGSLTWIYSEIDGFFEGFDTGDYVRIEHGFIMESYPGQTYASVIELIEDGNIYSFTDEEWERLSWPFTEPPVRDSADISEYLTEENGNQYLILPISRSKVYIWDQYKSQLSNIDLNLLREAEEHIIDEMSSYTASVNFFVEGDTSGHLYLCTEWIADIDPPNIETGDNGEVIENGCGIDHEHIFFSEIITK